MFLIGSKVRDSAQKRHATLKQPIASWKALIEACKAKSPTDLRKTFGSVDPVPPQTVFNLKGNSFRIIAEIDFDTQVVLVTHVLTHAEYDKAKWKRK